MSMPFVAFAEACGTTLTPAQRVLTAVSFDGVQPGDLSPEERALARELFGDVETVTPEQRRVIGWVIGARSGKSLLGSLRMLHLAYTLPLRGIAPGEIASCMIVAPDLRLAKQDLRYALGAARHVPELASAIVAEREESFTIRRDDGQLVTIECLPATAGGRATRGRSIPGALMNEACFFRDASAAVNDVDVYKSLIARLLPGAQLIVESTPWVEAGLLHDLWKANFGAPKSVLVAHAPTPLMRPDRPDLYEGDRADETWRVEFGAEWMTGGSELFFDSSMLAAAVRPFAPADFPKRKAGCDLGLVNDSSAAVVAGRRNVPDGTFEIAVLDDIEFKPERGTPLKLSAVVSGFAALLRRHGLQSIMSDGHSREAAREHAEREQITINDAPGGSGVFETYIFARTLLREGRLILPDNPRLLAQLRQIRSRALPGGGFRIEAPRRNGMGHCDLAAAAILAIWNAGQGSYLDGPPINLAGWAGLLAAHQRGMTVPNGPPDKRNPDGTRVLSKREAKAMQADIDRARLTRLPGAALDEVIARIREGYLK
ncbi:MAG: hypothetical protein JNL21_27630 [Myxococcales bacterium]|nr:hypothetical protein [Myxococcales bacterium]